MRLVEQAQQSKSNTQILADKAAGWLFYIALAVALLTAIAWTIATGFNAEVVARVATVLVIACPHALGLAVPLVVAISTSMGARNGILVRNRLALEESRLIDTVIFDKTGTLTVNSVSWQSGPQFMSENEALALASAIQHDSGTTLPRIRKSAGAPSHIFRFEAIRAVRLRMVDEHAVALADTSPGLNLSCQRNWTVTLQASRKAEVCTPL
jgi:Cu2+-exporting ATPase